MVTLVSISFLLLFHYGARKGKPILTFIVGVVLLIAPVSVDVIFHEYREVVKRIEAVEQQKPIIEKQSLKRKNNMKTFFIPCHVCTRIT